MYTTLPPNVWGSFCTHRLILLRKQNNHLEVYGDLAACHTRERSKDPYHKNHIESITKATPTPGSPPNHARRPKATNTHGSSASPRQHEPCAPPQPVRTHNTTISAATTAATTRDRTPNAVPPRRARCRLSSHVHNRTGFHPKSPLLQKHGDSQWCPRQGKRRPRAPPPLTPTTSMEAFARLGTMFAERSRPC
jgi:hypothetical protein